MNNKLQSIAKIIKDSKNVIVFAGAGMSAHIGNQTYWTGNTIKYGGNLTQYGLTTIEHATENTWRSHYQEQVAYTKQVTQNYENNMKASKENLYTKLLETFTQNNINYMIATSNVDNAFLHYGYNPQRVYEKHGNTFYLQCSQVRNHPVVPISVGLDSSCEECGSFLRPNTLMFYDTYFSSVRESEQFYVYDDFINDLEENPAPRTTILEIGVGTTVMNLRDMATKAYYRLNTAPFIHINPDIDPANHYSQIAMLTSRPKPVAHEYWVSATAEDLAEFL